MKKIIGCIVFLVITTSIYAQKKEKIKGDKEVVTTTHSITEGFNSLEVDDALEVTIGQSAQNGYTLTTDKNLQDVIQFTVKDSVLRIYSTYKITSSKKIELSLDFINLEYIILENDVRIEGAGLIESEQLDIKAYQSSKFELDVDVDELTINMLDNAGGKLKARTDKTSISMSDRSDFKASVISVSTIVTLTDSAQLTLEGDSDNTRFDLKDTASLDAKKMKVSQAILSASNNTDIYVYAGKNLEIYAKGKSTIYVYGDPKIDVKGLGDNAKIIKK